jgi:Protein of unknown function (DUF2785)
MSMFDASFWEKVKADDMRLPAGYPVDLLIEELEHLMRSPDERLRDKLAFEILGEWILAGHVDHDLEDFGDRLCAGLFRGLGEPEGEGVFGRSFSALCLGLAVERDNTASRVGPETIQRWLGAFLMWWELEADLRGVVDSRRGVANAVAHGADMFMAAARSRHLQPGQAKVLLGSIVVRLRTSGGYAFQFGEDDRLAYAVMALLHRGDVSAADLREALAPLAHIGRGGQRNDLDPGAFVRLNTLNWLRAMYLQLHLGVQGMPWHTDDGAHFARPIIERERMLADLASTLRFYSSWFAE